MDARGGTCKFEDKSFKIDKLWRLDKERLLSLRDKIIEEKAGLRELRNVAGSLNDTREINYLSKLHNVKILQISWIEKRIGVVEARGLAGDYQKKERTRTFHENFFLICQKRMSFEDFKAAANEAAAKTKDIDK